MTSLNDRWLLGNVAACLVPDNKVHGANTGPTWDQQDPGGPHVGHMNLVIWGVDCSICSMLFVYQGFIMLLCHSMSSTKFTTLNSRQAIILTNAGILLIRTLGTNFIEIVREIHTFSSKKMHLEMSSVKRRPFCLGLNVLINYQQ